LRLKKQVTAEEGKRILQKTGVYSSWILLFKKF